ncbi:hypothetical protein ACQ4PT_057374 [Festuca glaucescens]
MDQQRRAPPPSGEATSSVMCQLVNAEGENLGAALYLPQNVGPPQLQEIVNHLLHNVRHKNWVLCIAWSPDGKHLVSGSKSGELILWDPKTGNQLGTALTVAIRCPFDIPGTHLWHLGHGHWVNSLALSTEYVLRTGAYDHTGRTYSTPEEMKAAALARYETMRGNAPERLVSGSDDFTMFLWEPTMSKQPKARMTGHQKVVNHVYFSPDGQWLASASFDKSVKLWNGITGKFVAAFRGHVADVYQISWSADSRLLLSGSKDSTLKVRDIRARKLKLDLPGHADEVYAVDWSPDGEKVVSGDSDVGGPSFSYNTMSFDGPENWGKLSPAYKECGEGKAQSPIDIVTANAVPNPSLDNLTRVYAPTDATLNNNGKDITMTFEDHDGHSVAPGTILVCNPDGSMKAFGFKMIHWHSPSEHTIDGQRFPLELHLVHASEDGHLAVIGILYKIGDHDAFYDQLEDKLRELKTEHRVAAGLVELKSLQKRTGSYFRYMGSLTTPPCTENVIWNILGKVRRSAPSSCSCSRRHCRTRTTGRPSR